MSPIACCSLRCGLDIDTVNVCLAILAKMLRMAGGDPSLQVGWS